MESSLEERSSRKRLVRLFAAGLVILIILAMIRLPFWQATFFKPPEELLSLARTSLQEGDYELAERFAVRISKGDQLWVESRLIAGEAATRLERFDDAIRYYQAVPQNDSKSSILALYSLGELYRHVGELSRAIDTYQNVLKFAPDHVESHRRLALLLELSGQRWYAVPHFMYLVKSGTATFHDLVLLGDLERHLEQLDYLKQCAKRDPNDPLAKSGLAAYEILYGDLDDAYAAIMQVVDANPTFVPGQAMLGELLLDVAPERIVEWHQKLPAEANKYPDIWFVRGLWARQQKEFDIAVRCFWEALRLAPAHRRACYYLGQVLNSKEYPGAADFAERARLFIELSRQIDEILVRQGQDQQIMEQIVILLEETGRLWEAWAWSRLATQQFPEAIWAVESVQRLGSRLEPSLPRTIASENYTLRYDFSSYPPPQALMEGISRRGSNDETVEADSFIRFDEAEAIGIDFIYNNGPDPETKGVRMFESNGGGVAVLDFDGDEWPDLYFTQGSDWESGREAPTPSEQFQDRLYRNHQGRAFIDVTSLANLHNLDFGQGPAVGDFNNDGFPDLYVTNIGLNRLFVNNGDGTFSEVTQSVGTASQGWTSSGIMIDLNSDGLPDLFDVNYLTGKDLYSRICRGLACSPTVFQGSPDELYLNQGDGTFVYVPDATPEKDAKGMGVVSLVLDGDRSPSLFISNDQVPNFFLRNQANDGSAKFGLSNEAFLRGLAFNEDGLPMACMGIAVDDTNSDQLLDFFVTNFKDEANTVYLQDSPGLFIDATRKAGLFLPSFSFVGWGTQFLDADLDSYPDLVVVNGDVDDYRETGGEYQMYPQFFRNVGRGEFEELRPEQVGAYFDKKFLGRGLARLDWNRDGKMEFVVSNIGDQASLLINRSRTGHYLNVRLHATRSARDAIGANVTVKWEDRSERKQLTAGDGYMASNERTVQFGVGNSQSLDELVIEWPAGTRTILRNPPIDVTLEFVEGEELATVWRSLLPESLRLAP